MWRFLVVMSALLSVSISQSSGRLNVITGSLLQEFMNQLGSNQNIADINENSFDSQVCELILIKFKYCKG
jgi:hypothetical protein